MLARPAMTIRGIQWIRIDFERNIAAVTLSGVLCLEAIFLLLLAESIRRARLAFGVDVGLIGLVGGHFHLNVNDEQSKAERNDGGMRQADLYAYPSTSSILPISHCLSAFPSKSRVEQVARHA